MATPQKEKLIRASTHSALRVAARTMKASGAAEDDIRLLESYIEEMTSPDDLARAQATIAAIRRGERQYSECPVWKYRHRESTLAAT